MDRRNWIQMSKALVQKYKIYSLYSNIKNLPLQIFITAVANFSGPIALLIDKNINHQFHLPQNFINSIAIFNCKGELMKNISYNYKDKVIFMGFTKTEQLLIVQASGDYFLIDAFSGQTSHGNYTSTNEKQQKYRGCILMQNNQLVLIRQKQLGYTKSPKSFWEPLADIRVKFQNPIFSTVFNSTDEFTYLSKQNSIQIYNLTSSQKQTLYSDSFLNDNFQNLIGMSYNKQRNILGLVFLPHLIFYIDLNTNYHRKFDPMISLKYDLSCSNAQGLTLKYNSKSAYRPVNYTVGWLNGRFAMESDLQEVSTSILVFGNPKMLILYDGQSTRMTPRSNCNQLISVQFDSIRTYTEDSLEVYRVVPRLYATVIQIYKINQGYYMQKFRKIIQLHDEYTNYLQKDILDLSSFDELWKMGNRSKPVQQMELENQENQQQAQGQAEGNEAVEKYVSINYLNKQNPPQIMQKIQKIEQNIIRPLIKAVRFCIDPVDQVKMLRFIVFIKNLYTSPIDIYELCQQMRILNNLKFQFLNRTLTVSEFQYLKYDQKDTFLTILLRYRMHFIGDIIFKDSDSKYKIFLHWAKCKIQKNNEAVAYEQIKQKFEGIPKKNKSTKIFTDIAKYSLDRGRQGLADKIIELDDNPDRRIMVYLLMLATTKEKKIIQKLIIAAQSSSRSSLIYRVIKELIQSKWIENTFLVNSLFEKPNIARHYVRYLKSHNKQLQQQLIQNFYLQNKDYQTLGLFQIQRRLLLNKVDEVQVPKYSEQATNNFIPKVQEFKQLLPNLYSVTKSYSKNADLELLRKVKTTQYVPTEQEIKLVKNDSTLEYLGQILIQKQNTDAALSALKKIKSDKVYTILMRKQKMREALQLAFERKNKEIILQMKQKFSPEIQAQIDQRLLRLNKK